MKIPINGTVKKSAAVLATAAIIGLVGAVWSRLDKIETSQQSTNGEIVKLIAEQVAYKEWRERLEKKIDEIVEALKR